MFAPPIAAGQAMTLQEAIYSSESGTTTLAVQQAAFSATPSFSNVTGLTGLAVSSTPAHTAASSPPAVASRDLFQIVFTSGSSPVGVTVTLVFAVTA